MIDAAALDQFQRQWATYQKLVDADELSHKAVRQLLHDPHRDLCRAKARELFEDPTGYRVFRYDV